MTGLELVLVTGCSAVPTLAKRWRQRRALSRSIELETSLSLQDIATIKHDAIHALLAAEGRSRNRVGVELEVLRDGSLEERA